MKKLLLIVPLLALFAGFSDADQVSKSSTTLTNESACITARQLVRVMVGATSASGVLKVYNSTATVNNSNSTLISSFTLTVGNPLDFENLSVRGLCYVTVSNTNGVTIVYRQ